VRFYAYKVRAASQLKSKGSLKQQGKEEKTMTSNRIKFDTASNNRNTAGDLQDRTSPMSVGQTTTMLSKSLTLILAGFAAAASLAAGPLDDARQVFAGDVKSAYVETLNALEKNETDLAKPALAKLHGMMSNTFVGNWLAIGEVTKEVDPQLRSRWDETSRTMGAFNVAIADLERTVGKGDYKSKLSELQSTFSKFSEDFNKFYFENVEWGKKFQIEYVELGKKVQKFQNMCAGCR
jgi:hypothetical protein